uniref:Myostatin n=1 Tax=Eriocheir sinensis TaxID=95602 RepID=B6S3A2_ERISI|nr:myostatin [Eriocheir sinensis]
MPWKRLALVLLLMLLQAAATEARAQRNNKSKRRTQHQQHDKIRTTASEFVRMTRLPAGGTAHTANTAAGRQPPPLQPPQHDTHRQRHSGPRRNRPSQSQHATQRHNQHQPQAAENECPTCTQREMRKNLRLAQIKDRVLTATGLGTPPNMTGVVISSNPDVQGIIEGMKSAVPMPSNEPIYNPDEPDVKTETIFVPVEQVPSNLKIPEGTDVLYFRLNDTVVGSRPSRAILHMFLKPSDTRTADTASQVQVPASLIKASVSVFKVARPRRAGGNIQKTAVTQMMETYNPDKGNWVKVEVYSLLQEWLTRPEDNLGVVVEARDTQGNQVAVTDPWEIEETKDKIPLLEIHTEDANRRNRRNSAGSQCVNRNDSRCCRYALTVDFVDMGWDFIVAPKVYEANFCNGECPFLYAQKYAHTSLIQKMNSSAQHGPCCGARKLSPMKMLYYDHDHQIKFDIIQDMVVDHCGCT